MKFHLAKKGIYFIPATDSDREIAVKIGQGELIEAEFKKGRNYEFHKKFFVLINIGFENQEKEKNFALYRAKLMIQIGCCDVILLDDGSANFIPWSISYDKMPDNNTFEEVYNKAVDYIARQLYITNEELAMEVASHF